MVGLPEGAEGQKPAIFAETLFKQLLNLPDMMPTYVVERAHRVPMGKRLGGAPPIPGATFELLRQGYDLGRGKEES